MRHPLEGHEESELPRDKEGCLGCAMVILWVLFLLLPLLINGVVARHNAHCDGADPGTRVSGPPLTDDYVQFSPSYGLLNFTCTWRAPGRPDVVIEHDY